MRRIVASETVKHIALNLYDLVEFRALLLSKLDKPAFMFTKSAACHIVISDRMTTRAGTATHGIFRIKLNRRLLQANPHHIEQTFAHELAHLVAVELYGERAIGHGPLWARIMYMFGYPPRRCHTLDTTDLQTKHRTFAVYCNCKTHMVKTGRYNKMRRGRIFNCVLCKAAVRFNK